ncbi:MAG: signal peptidase I [Oscillospiraceae bacterium]|nr:signal peptidase I [Oscillospiraceae bacterium]
MDDNFDFKTEINTEPGQTRRSEEPDELKPRIAERLFELVEVTSSAFLIVVLVFTFVLRLVTVHGPSMQETLYDGDRLVITHMFLNPKQGDIIVIQLPQSPMPIIKRVVATEGQLIDIDFDKWEVTVYKDEKAYENGDGIILDEPYVNFDYMTDYGGEYITDSDGNRILRSPMNRDRLSSDSMPLKIEPGKVFVMGDNRNRSSDSRSEIGQIDARNIVGRVILRVFPLDKLGVVKPNEK